MSLTSEFAMSPPISVSGIESAISDTGSISAIGDEKGPTILTPVEIAASECLKSNKELVLEVPDVYEGFEFKDGDVCILVRDFAICLWRALKWLC